MKLIAEKACSLLEERVGLKYMHPIDITLGMRDDILKVAKKADREAKTGGEDPR